MKRNNVVSLSCQSKVLRLCSGLLPCSKVCVADGPKIKYTESPVAGSPFDSSKGGGRAVMLL